ncbi:MAG: sigma-70 family RNA polymerase sigma factor [Eubacteriales bacterium]|nr:sigma-70 family RNA polymerase sigma factor [Eubacteriales bacterium]
MMSNEEFEEFYTANLGFSRRVAERIVKNRAVAEDIAQDVFMSLYKGKEKLRIGEEKQLHCLVLRATVNKAYDYLKRVCGRVETGSLENEEEEEIYASSTTVEGRILERERCQYLGKLLRKLRQSNAMNYDIYMKIKIQGLAPELVAKEYGMTRNNVNNRIHRTKLWLREEYLRFFGQ